MTKLGVMVQGEIKNPEAFRSIKWSHVLVLMSTKEWQNDLANHYVGSGDTSIRDLAPQARLIVRRYHPDIMGASPEQRAEENCKLLDDNLIGPIDFICANELDLAGEHGGDMFRERQTAVDNEDVIVASKDWNSEKALSLIAAWLSRYADAHRALRGQDILHLPACSADMDIEEYLDAMPVKDFDVVDLHWYFPVMIGRIRELITDIGVLYQKPIFITEFNGDRNKIGMFIKAIGDTPAIYFLWSGNPDQAQYAIHNDPATIEVMRQAANEELVSTHVPDYVPEITGATGVNQGGETMPKPSIAWCPSLQNRNLYADSMGQNEYGAMRWLVEAKILPLCAKAGINADMFAPWSESNDATKYSGLHQQMTQATDWLDAQPVAPKAIICLHTDSGKPDEPDWPHTWVCIGQGNAQTVLLARDLLLPVADVFGHNDAGIHTEYGGHIFSKEAGGYPSVLVEICCHQSPRDLKVLYENPDAIAEALVAGVLAWTGQPPESPLTPTGEVLKRYQAIVEHADDIMARTRSRAVKNAAWSIQQIIAECKEIRGWEL